MIAGCRLGLSDNSASGRPGGSCGCRREGVIALVLTTVSSALVVRDPVVVTHGVLPRRGLDISSPRVVPAHTARRDPPSLLLSDEQRSARKGKRRKTKPTVKCI